MENLLIEPLPAAKLSQHLNRIGDLVNFEGPIVSLFEDLRNNHLYIFDWVDRDKTSNRWIIYRVKAQDLWLYLRKEISYFDLFQSYSRGNYYVAHIGSFTNGAYELFKLNELPRKYLPNQDDYFEKNDCPFYDKIVSFVIERLKNQKQENDYYITGKLLRKSNVQLFANRIAAFRASGNERVNRGNIFSGGEKHVFASLTHNEYRSEGVSKIHTKRSAKSYKNVYNRIA
jgi:hypothetical protein